MARYIDKDKLMAELDREVKLADDWETAHELANVVKYFPSADVAEVVRCRECKHKAEGQGYCYKHGIWLHRMTFCSVGERREDG